MKIIDKTDYIKEILTAYGEDPNREGLKKTPDRFLKSLEFLMSGANEHPKEVVGEALFHEKFDDMVLVKDIEFYSLCEHHLLPFFGKVHVAYIPNGKIIGLSKIPRIVDIYSRRLQVQERLTDQIASCLQDILNPQGVGVVIKASHLCMMMRGVQKQETSTLTSSMRGCFRNLETREEFIRLVR
jgi:GTP cyclohydrolase I